MTHTCFVCTTRQYTWCA